MDNHVHQDKVQRQRCHQLGQDFEENFLGLGSLDLSQLLMIKLM